MKNLYKVMCLIFGCCVMSSAFATEVVDKLNRGSTVIDIDGLLVSFPLVHCPKPKPEEPFSEVAIQCSFKKEKLKGQVMPSRDEGKIMQLDLNPIKETNLKIQVMQPQDESKIRQLKAEVLDLKKQIKEEDARQRALDFEEQKVYAAALDMWANEKEKRIALETQREEQKAQSQNEIQLLKQQLEDQRTQSQRGPLNLQKESPSVQQQLLKDLQKQLQNQDDAAKLLVQTMIEQKNEIERLKKKVESRQQKIDGQSATIQAQQEELKNCKDLLVETLSQGREYK